eukprot:CAMPEP_0118912806 /NCGR_PEP_ID=MMETSP1166-20130328/13883_1 /TAXON_ID=1104430 /ORGANISM="Chrysoreinhardia sp, Strain CCMP3193" /LENGTH=104 /DNA_ID=CAMNT_0006852329 /DNA_START=815 /DNA_END=1125 /DNA_ORIENTATION=+
MEEDEDEETPQVSIDVTRLAQLIPTAPKEEDADSPHVSIDEKRLAQLIGGKDDDDDDEDDDDEDDDDEGELRVSRLLRRGASEDPATPRRGPVVAVVATRQQST